MPLNYVEVGLSGCGELCLKHYLHWCTMYGVCMAGHIELAKSLIVNIQLYTSDNPPRIFVPMTPNICMDPMGMWPNYRRDSHLVPICRYMSDAYDEAITPYVSMRELRVITATCAQGACVGGQLDVLKMLAQYDGLRLYRVYCRSVNYPAIREWAGNLIKELGGDISTPVPEGRCASGCKCIRITRP